MSVLRDVPCSLTKRCAVQRLMLALTAAAAAALRAEDNSDMIVKAMAGPMSPKQVGMYRLLKAISVIAVMFKTKIMVQVLDFFYLN